MGYLEYIKKKEYLTPTISFEEIEEECDILAGSPDTGTVTNPEEGEGDIVDAKSALTGSWGDEETYFEDEWE